MIRPIGLRPILGAVVTAWLLSGCAAPNPKGSAGPSNGCPATPYSHQDDPDDNYVDIPLPVSGENIEDVLIPGGRMVGCENPRFRLVHGDELAAFNLFDRLTKYAPGGYTQGNLDPHPDTKNYGAPNFLTDVRIRNIDRVVVGWRTHIGCRRPLVWIFRWLGESGQKPGVKPVLLEYTDEQLAEQCKSQEKSRDADGGGP